MRELFLIAEARRNIALAESKSALVTAWHMAALSRIKDFPRLETLLDISPRGPEQVDEAARNHERIMREFAATKSGA